MHHEDGLALGPVEGHGQRRVGRGVAQHVAHQVGHHLVQAGAVAGHHHRLVRPRPRDRAVRREHVEVAQHVVDHASQVHRLAVQREVGVQPGQQGHLLHEVAHPGGLGLDPLHRAVRAGVVQTALEVQVRPAVHAGQRGAQLVGGVGDEVPDPLLGLRAGVERAVHGVRERCGLGQGAQRGQAQRVVTGRDPVGAVRHPLQRAQTPAHGPPHRQQARGRDQGADQQRRQRGASHGAPVVGHVTGQHHGVDGLLGPVVQAHGQARGLHPDRAQAGGERPGSVAERRELLGARRRDRGAAARQGGDHAAVVQQVDLHGPHTGGQQALQRLLAEGVPGTLLQGGAQRPPGGHELLVGPLAQVGAQREHPDHAGQRQAQHHCDPDQRRRAAPQRPHGSSPRRA